MAKALGRRLASTFDVFVLLGRGPIQAQTAQQKRESSWLALLGSKYPSRSGMIAIKPTTNATYCAIAMAAFHEVAAGSDVEFGVMKADTAQISAIEIFDRNYGGARVGVDCSL